MKINAVFEGGGVKGISLAGAVRAAEMQGIKFEQVAGTSSGAIIATLLAANYSGLEIKRIVENTPFTSFLKRSFIFNMKVISPALRLLVKKGLYSGEAFEYWVSSLLEAKGIRTFGDLPDCKLRIVASDITNGRLLVLPEDIKIYGMDPKKFSIARAVRMSASIPYFFDPVIVRYSKLLSSTNTATEKPKLQQAYIVDGGLLSNFPLWLFDREQAGRENPVPTVGFQMVGKNNNEPHEIRGPLSMLEAIFETMMQAHDERYIKKYARDRTVKIPTLGVRTTQFHLPEGMVELLFQSGFRAANQFFEGFRH
ncbi:patatin-like phospholipase family protein [Paenibacillus glycanilyticus]|uniref:Phospholipase n=1 Tax=Paenibacillus glycanilyticus TaxID=126569 RepID=A0ABQ6GJ93_9BACL|nr:patatin-like phospholipase family protein [Paenibacillus glycanilyticus]GLX69112.1 phospholipase [Paenibacillus glycanilyticus]